MAMKDSDVALYIGGGALVAYLAAKALGKDDDGGSGGGGGGGGGGGDPPVCTRACDMLGGCPHGRICESGCCTRGGCTSGLIPSGVSHVGCFDGGATHVGETLPTRMPNWVPWTSRRGPDGRISARQVKTYIFNIAYDIDTSAWGGWTFTPTIFAKVDFGLKNFPDGREGDPAGSYIEHTVYHVVELPRGQYPNDIRGTFDIAGTLPGVFYYDWVRIHANWTLGGSSSGPGDPVMVEHQTSIIPLQT